MVTLVSSDASAANLPVLVQGMQGLFAALLGANECDAPAHDTEPSIECSDPKSQEEENSGSEAKKSDVRASEPVVVPVVITVPLQLPAELRSEQDTEMRQGGKDLDGSCVPATGTNPDMKASGTTKGEGGVVSPREAQESPALPMPMAAVGESGFNELISQVAALDAQSTTNIKDADPAKTEVKANDPQVDAAPFNDSFVRPGTATKEDGTTAQKEASRSLRREAVRVVAPRQDIEFMHRKVSFETNVLIGPAKESNTDCGAANLAPPYQYTESDINAASIRMEAMSERTLPPVAMNTERLVERLAGPEMRFTVNLHDSGNVQVVTNMRDRTMQVGMLADRAETVSALRSDVPYLESRIRSQAMELGEVKISLQETGTTNSGYSGEHRSRQEWRTSSPVLTGPEPSSRRVSEVDDVLYGRQNDGLVGWLA